MSATIREAPARESSCRDSEKRVLFPGAPWGLSEAFVDLLPEGSPVRAAYDGKDLEIMVTGPLHDDLADLLDAFFPNSYSTPLALHRLRKERKSYFPCVPQLSRQSQRHPGQRRPCQV